MSATRSQDSSRSMRETTPSVFLIARPSVDLAAMRAYLEEVGGESWLDMREAEGSEPVPGGELLAEFAGRMCYRSWEPGLNAIGLRVPEALEPVRDQVISLVEQLEEFQVSAAEALGLDDDGVPFAVKKEVTSALRRLAPIGLSTDIVWTANVRTLRHVVEMRTAPGAEEELRLVFDRVADLARREVPGLFQDFH